MYCFILFFIIILYFGLLGLFILYFWASLSMNLATKLENIQTSQAHFKWKLKELCISVIDFISYSYMLFFAFWIKIQYWLLHVPSTVLTCNLLRQHFLISISMKHPCSSGNHFLYIHFHILNMLQARLWYLLLNLTLVILHPCRSLNINTQPVNDILFLSVFP